MNLNAQVQKAFSRLRNLAQCDLPSRELKAKLLSELSNALYELQTTAIELHEQNEQMVVSRQIIEEERSRYQELFDFAPDGYLVTDTEGIILEANSSATNLLKVSKSGLIGKPLAIFVRGDEHITFCTRLVEMKKETVLRNDHWEVTMLSGKRTAIPASITVGRVISSRRGTAELRWLLRDITQYKHMEDEKERRTADLVVANQELVYQNEEKEKRAAELVIINEELARLDRLNLVGQLAAGIAHEIRNPMTTVRGYLQLLGENSDYSVKKPTFDLMITELDRANAIITEFLSLSQTKPAEQRYQSLNDLINNLYPLLESDAFTRNKDINFTAGEISNLKLNGKEISQMVLNLVRNGLEAMEERGCLTIRSYVMDNKVVLEIADEGCGIPAEQISKIGTPFFTTKDTGTGLGLASCYRIAESHQAKIQIESDSKGTTFNILFPIQIEDQ